MSVDYQHLVLDYVRSIDQDASSPVRHPVVVLGAGPVGFATAMDLAQRGVPVVLLDDDNKLSFGSRGLCYSKRTLEILDRLGCGQRMVDKGVSWGVGKVFLQDELVYTFDLLPELGHKRPAFINLQQYYLEGYLYDHAITISGLDIRWCNKVLDLVSSEDGVTVKIETPEGPYEVLADYVIACDGAKSVARKALGLESTGRIFKDRFLIADVKMKADFPTERWFWFDAPFHPNQSTLLHRQPDDVWRIDFQLGWDADPEEERKPEKVIPRVKALLGNDTDFELEWVSIYTFACLRMDKFRHGRVIFAGDSAHGVSPFGARGANSGIQDADNLAWKLAMVLNGLAPDALLNSYASEREFAADENILNSTRSTDFITPKSEISRIFRDATLALSKDFPFARKLVNSGRLSVPSILDNSPLNTSDAESFTSTMRPGAPCVDAPVKSVQGDDWFLSHVGQGFTCVYFSDGTSASQDFVQFAQELSSGSIPINLVSVVPKGTSPMTLAGVVCLEDTEGLVASRCDARGGTTYVLRPDQHVCARFREFDPQKVRGAVQRATLNA